MRGPWHIWVIGIVTLSWNTMGAFDFLVTQTRNAESMGNFTPEQLEYFYGFPLWVVVFWGIAVWGGVLGSLLLLLRKRLAVPVFLTSFIAVVITMIHNFGFSKGMEMMGDAVGLTMTGLVFVIALALFLYARAMQRRWVLV